MEKKQEGNRDKIGRTSQDRQYIVLAGRQGAPGQERKRTTEDGGEPWDSQFKKRTMAAGPRPVPKKAVISTRVDDDDNTTTTTTTNHRCALARPGEDVVSISLELVAR